MSKSVSEPHVPVCLMLSTQEGNLFDLSEIHKLFGFLYINTHFNFNTCICKLSKFSLVGIIFMLGHLMSKPAIEGILFLA